MKRRNDPRLPDTAINGREAWGVETIYGTPPAQSRRIKYFSTLPECNILEVLFYDLTKTCKLILALPDGRLRRVFIQTDGLYSMQIIPTVNGYA